MASCTLCASLLQVSRSEPRFTTRDEAQSHATQHLSQLKHFDDKTCSSVVKLFDKCFPNFGVTPVRKQKRIVVKKEGRQTLLNVCHTVFKGRISKDSPRVTCQKCESRIVLYGVYNSGPQFEVAINHASAHLGIGLFECRKCGRGFGNKKALCNHLRVTHRLRCRSEYFMDTSGDYIDEIGNSIEQCFTEGNHNEPSNEKARKIRRRSLLHVCHTVFKGRISKTTPHVSCQKCGSEITLYDGKQKKHRFEIAISHASGHLGIHLFECRQCGRSFRSKSAVYRHLRVTHGLRYLSEYFTNKSGDFIEEITNSIEQCFTEGNVNGPSDEKARMIRLKEEAIVRSKTKGTKLAMERQLFCYRLIRQLASDDGKVQCRSCPKRICIKLDGRYKVQYAMDHAVVHLKKPLFRCKVCWYVRHSRKTMCLHLKSVHALQSFMNYECLADEFHTDILDVLRKCYAEEQGK